MLTYGHQSEVVGGTPPTLSLNFITQVYRRGVSEKTFADLITCTRASGAGCYNSQGVYEWLGNNVQRFDYDPATLQPRGLLVEEQRTNLLTYSADFTQVSWSATEVTITPAAISAPDGTVSGTKLAATAVNSSHPLAKNSTLTSGTTYTQSFFFKAAGVNYVQLAGSTGFDTTHYANFDLTNGTVSKVVGGTAAIATIGNGWYRCSLTTTATATNGQIAIFLITDAQANRGPSFAGNGVDGIYVWGAQLEAASYRSSYIPTTTAQVTRAADVVSVSASAPWFRATEGTLFVNGSGRVGASGSSASLANMGNTSEYHAMIQQTSSTRNGTTRVGGVNPVSLATSVAQGDAAKSAYAYKVNDFAHSVNGSVPATDTSGDLPTSAVTLKVGNFNNTNNFANGHIREIRFYPRRLTNAELQALTT